MTSLISASGRQFEDWSADYRLFSQRRFDADELFDAIRGQVLDYLGPDRPLVVAMDDTVSRKNGRKIPGTSWRRDPMSPPFQANLVWGRRFIQISALLPPDRDEAPGRAVPIDFTHAPTPAKPKRNAPAPQHAEYRRASRKQTLARQGVQRLQNLRTKLSTENHEDRDLWVCADGSYTNSIVLKNLPRQTTFIGRIRQDARLHRMPNPERQARLGRRRLYGLETLTPEAVRQDPGVPWQDARVYAAGKVHDMRYKTVEPLLWRTAGADRPLKLLIIAPLRYQVSKHSRTLYRRPAFLICTDPDLDSAEILKAYVSRWDIEVNFRDQKQIIGFDEAQVRTPQSAESAPAFAVAAYAVLLLAAARAFGINGLPAALPPPKWRAKHVKPRASTPDLLNQLRYELWGRAIANAHFSGFPHTKNSHTKPEKLKPDLAATVFYAHSRA